MRMGFQNWEFTLLSYLGCRELCECTGRLDPMGHGDRIDNYGIRVGGTQAVY